MGKMFFKAELLDDVVLSQRTATVGEHKSLDYIPGSVFLGIVASKLYSKISKDDAWNLFHSSKVRFCNAYPMISEKRSTPMPLSLHSEKVPRSGKEESVLNFIYPEIKEEGIQYRQNRNGYVCINNDKIIIDIPSKTSRMRTAIDVKTGTAAKSQLYGYESLNADQSFVGKIEWDESVLDLITPIINIFKDGEVVHIGRSKTASYGRVKVSGIDIKDNHVDNVCGSSFSILAVSDLCLKNPITGIPELNLSPIFLGLGNDWSLDKTKSFSRPLCLYQYNAYRKEIEMQKTLISKGSVFTFKSDKELTLQEKEVIISAIKNGIGDAKGQGFGEIALFDVGTELVRESSNEAFSIIEQKLSVEEQKWFEWLKPFFITKDVEEKVKKGLKDFIELCKYIKQFNTFENEFIFWPGNAQWSRILETTRKCRTKNELFTTLFESDAAIIKQKNISKTEKHGDSKEHNPDKEWNYEASSEGKTLRKWLMDFVNDQNMNDEDIKIAIQELVKRCKDKIADKNWLNGGSK